MIVNQEATIGDRNGQADSVIKSRPEGSIPLTANHLVGDHQPHPTPAEFAEGDQGKLSRKDDLVSRADAVAAAALQSAEAVDAQARFPHESFQAARDQRLLGIMVPTELGGEGASVSDVADICYLLGRSCGSTAMIFAMHQIMVAILVRHARNSAWHSRLLCKLCAEQLLLASSTTEGQGGGDLRSSASAVERQGSRIAFTKSATVMSYGLHADAVVTTARRAADAAPSDQVLVAFLKEQYRLEPIASWNTLGMRGTCSAGFKFEGNGEGEQVLPVPYQTIHSHTMMPVAHLTWSAVWTGVAAAAVERARRFVRTTARRNAGQLPPGAAHLTRATMSLRGLRDAVELALVRFEKAGSSADRLEAIEFQNTMNLLKVTASETAIAVAMSAMQACGLSGYRNDGEFSVSRNLRDALSSSIMINNDRILASAASTSSLIEVPHLLRSV
jgi:acyl-CoA dehydrogenase